MSGQEQRSESSTQDLSSGGFSDPPGQRVARALGLGLAAATAAEPESSTPQPAAPLDKSSRSSDTFRLLRPQTILSLCDGLGSWSQPYVDDGYDVIRVDLAAGQDVRLMQFPAKPIHGVLAAPPCTVFANSGARWARTEQEIRDGLSVVDACLRIIVATRPEWWVLENPPGKLTQYLGPPRLTFQPNEYGDDYTKQTNLWGSFNLPARTPVPATAGSKMHRLSPSPDRAALRSVTPEGFARAFFEANP